jgi:hypothetical protein
MLGGNMKKIIQLLFILITLGNLVSCSGGYGSGRIDSILAEIEANRERRTQFTNYLNTVEGYNLQLVKIYTKRTGYLVFQNMATGEYLAVNYSRWDGTTLSPATDWIESLSAGDIVAELERGTEEYWDTETHTDTYQDWIEGEYGYDEYGDYVYFPGYYETVTETWTEQVLKSRYIYTYGDFIFDETYSSTKDLEKMAGMIEKEKVSDLGDLLSAQYGLSEDRAIAIAKVSTAMNEITKSRALTEADLNAFTGEVFGSKWSDISKAVKGYKIEGKKKSYDNLIDKAADTNGVSPEHMRKIVDAYLL